MGICISVGYSEIHETAEDVYENVIIFEANKVANGTRRFGSVYSKQGSKGLNQDTATLYQGYGMEDGAFCGVFDGHGRNGHIVSQTVNGRLPSLLLSQKNAIAKIDTVANGYGFPNHVNTEDDHSATNENFQKWKEAILSAFRVMEKEVKLKENLDCFSSGTTAIVVLRQGQDLVIANLGDSRAILGTTCDGEISAIQLTNDLKPGLPLEADRIRSCNGRVFALKEEPHIQRVWLPNVDSPGLAMSRAFGDFMLKDHGVIAVPDISYHRLTSTDQFIVLASDGVWDVLSNDEVASIVWTAHSEEAAAKAVVKAATAEWKNKYPSSKVDDCTAVCLFLHEKNRATSCPKGENLNL